MTDVDVAEAIAALRGLIPAMHHAVYEGVDDSLKILKRVASATAPKGIPGNSTNPPGDLGRSMRISGPFGASGTTRGKMGPTKVYSRQRELGGHIYAGRIARSVGSKNIGGRRVGKPLLVFTKYGTTYYTPHVYQGPNPYMKRSVYASLRPIQRAMRSRVADAIRSV
ncbi:MAG: hypothetical protein KGL39_04350 [Patescibacteria group bacterium]|nr:hypothetical protein [Patescibacteria group bacterium]